MWNNVIYGPFLRSKVWLLFTLLVFLMSQSILKTWHAEDEATQQTLRIAILRLRSRMLLFFFGWLCCVRAASVQAACSIKDCCLSGFRILCEHAGVSWLLSRNHSTGLQCVSCLLEDRAEVDILPYKSDVQVYRRWGHHPCMPDPRACEGCFGFSLACNLPRCVIVFLAGIQNLAETSCADANICRSCSKRSSR